MPTLKITDFIVRYGNLSAPTPEKEIARLIKKSKEQQLLYDEDSLQANFYRLKEEEEEEQKRIFNTFQGEPGARVPPPTEKKAVAPPQAGPKAVVLPKVAKTELKPSQLVQEELVGVSDRPAEVLQQTQEVLQAPEEESRALKIRNQKLQEENVKLREELESVQQQLEALQSSLRSLINKSPEKTKELETPKYFPKKSLSENSDILYAREFIIKYLQLQEEEKKQVLKGLENMAKFGYRYSSLQSKKIKNPTPQGAEFSSRASRGLRLYWKKESGTIVFLEVRRRGDTGFSES